MRTAWFSARSWRLHLTLAVLLPGFAALFDWQLHRALAGNALSWAYTIEWPIFAGYAVFMWWKLVHEDSEHGIVRHRRSRAEDSGELAAYNDYLGRLAEEDRLAAAPGQPNAPVSSAEGDPARPIEPERPPRTAEGQTT